MPTYHYLCLDCQKQAESVKGSELIGTEMWEVVFETSHRMEPTKKELRQARECPRCGGYNTEQTMFGVDIAVAYIRGNGYLDQVGRRRDMHLHKLKTEDPYAEHRTPGEVDDLEVRLKRAGQHNPNTRYFPT
jgi:hypothetical protein